ICSLGLRYQQDHVRSAQSRHHRPCGLASAKCMRHILYFQILYAIFDDQKRTLYDGAALMIDPIVHKVLLGTIIYGIVLCLASGSFQLFRKEKKSATFLLSTGTVMLILTVIVRMLRTGAI